MPTIVRKDITLISRTYNNTTTAYSPANGILGFTRFYPSYFDPITEIYFEVTVQPVLIKVINPMGRAYARLYNNTTALTVSTLSTGSAGYQRLRSGNLVGTLIATADLSVQFKHDADPGSSNYNHTARLIIIQNGTQKKTATYFMIGDYFATKNVAATEVDHPKRMWLDTNDYDGTITYEVQATTIGKGIPPISIAPTIEAYDVTNATILSSMTPVVVTTSPVLLIDTHPLNTNPPVDDSEITCRLKHPTGFGASVRCYGMHFLVIQTDATNLTKTTNVQQIFAGQGFSESDLAYDAAERRGGNFDPNDYQGCNIDTDHEATIKLSAAVGIGYLKLIHGVATIVGSELSTTIATYARYTAASLTEPGSDDDVSMDAYITLAGAGAILTTSSRIIVHLTNIEIPGINIQLNKTDVWKDADSAQINIGDVWKAVEEIWENIGDVWKRVF